MQFSDTDDLRMLAESLRGHLARSGARAVREPGTQDSLWRELAELGIVGATLPEEYGGTGGGGRELVVIAGELGRARCISPYVSTATLFANMILEGGSERQKAELLPRVAVGEITGSLAWQERHARYGIDDIACAAIPDDGGWMLNGRKAQVFYGDRIGHLLVTARIEGSSDIGVFLMDAHAAGIERHPLVLVDGQPAADIVFENVWVSGDAHLPAGVALVRRALDWANVAFCAEAVACMDELLRLTVEYIRVRVQFGKPIGKNQALQHRAADMLMQVERARSMSLLAAESLAYPSGLERDRAIAQAAYIIGNASRFVSEQAIQLHGGIGMTEESDVSRYVRRLFLNRVLLGDGEEQLDRLSHIPHALAVTA